MSLVVCGKLIKYILIIRLVYL